MLGHGEPIRVKQGERVLFHIVNGSATEIRSLALPGHTLRGRGARRQPGAESRRVPVLWLGTAERISAIVEMKHPGVWVLGDLADDDRGNGMGIVVEYAGRTGKPKWVKPAGVSLGLYAFSANRTSAAAPDETFEMTFAKNNAALRRLQRMDHQRRRLLDGEDGPDRSA